MRTRFVVVGVLVAALVPTIAAGALEKNSLHATLTGAAERPKGDPDGRGTAEIKINGRQVCWELTVSRIGKPNAAHIHKGRAGVAGPVVVPLGAAYKSKGCTRATAAVASAIAARPGAYYVNVHNAKYPAGAVRGQLRS
jgi:CHRD domain